MEILTMFVLVIYRKLLAILSVLSSVTMASYIGK